MTSLDCDLMNLWMFVDRPIKDERTFSEIREEFNMSLLGILGYSYKESIDYINEDIYTIKD